MRVARRLPDSRLSRPVGGTGAAYGISTYKISLIERRRGLHPLNKIMELFCLIIPVAVIAKNRVLQLNGGDDCVKLPSDIFNAFDEATVEVWVKWQSFRHHSQVFNFGAKERMMVDHSLPNLRFYIAVDNGIQ